MAYTMSLSNGASLSLRTPQPDNSPSTAARPGCGDGIIGGGDFAATISPRMTLTTTHSKASVHSTTPARQIGFMPYSDLRPYD